MNNTTTKHTTMKVISFIPTDGIQAGKHRKENNFLESYSIIVKGKTHQGKQELQEIASLRIYGTNAMNYACLWINDRGNNTYCNGSGSAGGYGYHRPSAAAAEALKTAGIKLSEDIDGRGDSAIIDALTAIAKKQGYKTFLIHKAHA
jgi:hypothetical protein